MKHIDPKISMLEHSEAKVKLYGTYLSIYLNILSRVPLIEKIFIFDLFCGEGVYEGGGKGSPIIALDAIKNHYFSNKNTCPNITVWFNDNGESEIEPGISKVDRVQKLCKSKFIPPNVTLEFKNYDYDTILPQALNIIRTTKKAKGLFFLDPYGYKDIKLADICKILLGGRTEVIWFLPISYMYRFAEKALKSSFYGSEPLHAFLIDLFGNSHPAFESVHDFIFQIKEGFRAKLGTNSIFVDTFSIERDSRNYYCLFFFTSSIKGFEKMLEAKWKIDTNRGKGFSLEKTMTFFNEIELSGYPDKLCKFILSAQYRSNVELYRYGLENGFLPKHTIEVLKRWKDRGDLNILALDAKPVKGYYLSDHDRCVGFTIKS